MPRTSRSRKPSWDGLSPGGFTANGSWNDDGHPGTPLMLLVRELVRLRHYGSTPAEIVRAIPEPLLAAFPNASHWSTIEAEHWWLARCSTSAESAVVYCFRKPSGEPTDQRPVAPEPETLGLGQ